MQNGGATCIILINRLVNPASPNLALTKILMMYTVAVCAHVLRSYLVQTSQGKAESEAAALSWPARSIWPALPETVSATMKKTISQPSHMHALLYSNTLNYSIKMYNI